MITPSQTLTGERYQAVVPDTLDLAGRAAVALNALTGRFNPDYDYEAYEVAHFHAQPPYMQFRHGGFLISAKLAESFPMMRVMSGSDLNLDLEHHMMETMMSLIGDDGLFYCPNTTPWRRAGRGYEGIDEDYSNVMENGRMMLSMMAWYARDHDPAWLDGIASMAEGLARIAITKDDYAYYPEGKVVYEYSYPRSGWRDTAEPGWEGEGGAITYHGPQVRALSRWYAMTGDQKALDLATKLVNFLLHPRWWGVASGAPEPDAVVGHEHGQAAYHLNGREMVLRALIEYAAATHDLRLTEFVREGYEYIRQMGIPRIGWIPHYQGRCGCWAGRLVALAIKLCDAGYDYWEDVDQYVRNELVEQQVLRPDLVRAISEAGPLHDVSLPQETADRVIERNIGALAHFGGDPTCLGTDLGSASCCLQAGSQGLYSAWEGIVCCTGGVAQVNLLLNRASPWLDLDSSLPYEGRVVIKNKSARKLFLRIPRWVQKPALRCRVNEQATTLPWLGNYLVFEALRPGDVVAVEFPMVEEVVTYTSRGRPHIPEIVAAAQEATEEEHDQVELASGSTRYTLHLKGNTLVDISPRAAGVGYPIYMREHYRRDRAPVREVTRYVSGIDLGSC